MSPVKKRSSNSEITQEQQWEAAAKECLGLAVPVSRIETGRKLQRGDEDLCRIGGKGN